MDSFAILSTNVGLTTNIKIMVDSNYNLSLNSIDSKDELSNSKFKKVSFVKNNYYDELVRFFYQDLPSDIAFYTKYDNDVSTMGRNYSNQYDELYQCGARNIINNKDYSEEYEYFAPLYISPGNLPTNFIIFRVDGSGIDNITKDNVKSKIFQKFKTIKLFELTNKSIIGEWLDKNFNNNPYFPLTPFEMSFQNLEFSKWNGIDYQSGGFTSKSMFLENVYETEKEIFEMERFIYDGYKNNKVVFPNILNLSFLFDDNPANSDTLEKWSINRYYGFYLNGIIKSKTMSPYIPQSIKSDAIILDNNLIYSPTGDPFVNGFKSNCYVEYNGNYYKVEILTETTSNMVLKYIQKGSVITQEYVEEILTQYKIISDINLKGKESLLNTNSGFINDTNTLLKYDNSNFTIEDWDSADVWIIEIDGMYHNLVNDSNSIKINSDYSFKVGKNDYTYWVNKNDPNYTKVVSTIVDENNEPKIFSIYKLKFTDIKNFDNRIVDTEYSKFEYENKYSLTNTDESKMYLTNLSSKSNPKEYDDFIYKGSVVNIPVSSEYTANYETFRINNGELSDIWRKNPIYCRWGFQNSLSSNDYPYLLNNSLIFEDFNRTVNPFDPVPKRIERNLDYFYTINSSTSSYVHHTLHVENKLNGDIDPSFRFELDKYLNLGTYSLGTSSQIYDFDYFSYFFEKKMYFYDSIKNVKKYSLFNNSDNTIPNITLFRGIKFLIYNVEDIKRDQSGKIDNINLKSLNTFDGYKFSILLSSNDYTVINTSLSNNNATMSSSSNSMNWYIVDEWKMDKTYQDLDIVIMDDILYQSTTSSNITTNPQYNGSKSAPYNQPNWICYNQPYNIFWSPNKISSYDATNIVYNNGDYYIYDGGNDDFWNPYDTYSYGDIVHFKGNYYQSTTSSNTHRPDYKQPYRQNSNWVNYWSICQSVSQSWVLISLWNSNIYYTSNENVVHNNIVYYCSTSQSGNEPGISNIWIRRYSMIPDTSIVYGQSSNLIIEMNNSYYIMQNSSTSTLENGINIYINKKWKNILINITISDNTTPNLSESDRDLLYSDLNRKLTAYNFIQCLNDIVDKYNFTDYLNYIIIDEDNNITKYNYNNIEGLPYYITCETPDEVKVKNNSLIYDPVPITKDLKSSKTITTINDDLSNINDYNNIPPAASIINNLDNPIMVKNYSKMTNITDNTIYRFSGFYMPIFYDIQLFTKNYFTSSTGNYIFDTELSEFGMVKERKISKVNHTNMSLKLNNKNQESIYPMLDEFGYTIMDFFIFKSSWDINYYKITSLYNYVQIISPYLISNINMGAPVFINKNTSF